MTCTELRKSFEASSSVAAPSNQINPFHSSFTAHISILSSTFTSLLALTHRLFAWFEFADYFFKFRSDHEILNNCCDISRDRRDRHSRYVVPASASCTGSEGAVMGALLTAIAYAVYFDHRRRTDPEFRKALKRQARRQARIAKEEAEIQGKQQQEEIKRTVEEALDEGFPTDLEEREAFFMQQISQGEALAADGSHSQSNLRFEKLTPSLGSDPVGAALCFYKGLKVYPEPKSLIGIYENTVPKNVQEILAVMVSQDRSLNVGSFGASSPKSESGPGVE